MIGESIRDLFVGSLSLVFVGVAITSIVLVLLVFGLVATFRNTFLKRKS